MLLARQNRDQNIFMREQLSYLRSISDVSMVVIAHEGLVGPLPVVHIPPSRLLYICIEKLELLHQSEEELITNN